MRGPELIYQFDPDAKSQKRISVALHLNESTDEKRIVSLKWLVSGYSEGAYLCIFVVYYG